MSDIQNETAPLNEQPKDDEPQKAIDASSKNQIKEEQDKAKQAKQREKEVKRNEHNKKVLAELSPGDLVQYKRDLYSHWAVYIGHEKIIHLHGNTEATFSGVGLFSANVVGQAVVKIDPFCSILRDSYAFRNNSKDSELRALNPTDIVLRAYGKVGSEYYDLLTYNCEHFANWCRYDLPFSDQATKVFNFGSKVVYELQSVKGFVKDVFTGKTRKQLSVDDELIAKYQTSNEALKHYSSDIENEKNIISNDK